MNPHSGETRDDLIEGDAARELFSKATASFPAEISYVVAKIGPLGPVARHGDLPEDGLWFDPTTLAEDPDWLGALIAATGAAIGTDDPQVAASLFVQGYSYRILMVAIACLTTSGVLPDFSADRTVVSFSRGRPYIVGYQRPSLLSFEPLDATGALSPRDAVRAVDFIHETAIGCNIDRIARTTRRSIRVGTRLLWGNVAASAAVAFRTMDGCVGRGVRPLGELFFERAPSRLQGLGSYLSLQAGDKNGWFWERTNCCLYERLPGNIRCADCSLTPPEKRRAAYLQSLAQR